MSSCAKPKRFRKNLNFTQKLFKKRKSSKKRTQQLQLNDDINQSNKYFKSCKGYIKKSKLLTTSDSYYTPKSTINDDSIEYESFSRGNLIHITFINE